MKNIFLISVLAILPIVFFGCESSKTESESLKTAEEKEPSKTAEELWESCSSCHSFERLEGKTAAEIKEAINTVRAMERFKSELSDDEISLISTLLVGEPKKEEYTYILSDACKNCHPNHVSQWKQSLHSMAHFEQVYDYYFIKASQDTNKEIEPFCGSCHTPIAVINKTIPFTNPLKSPGDTKVSAVENDGVQCDFCHLISGVRELRNSGYELSPSRAKLGPYHDSNTMFHETAYSELHTKPELCGTCHNVDHPVNGIVLEATYTEWKNGPYAEEGVICQDCHMTSGLTKAEVMPGKAAKNGPDREHVSEHYFVGPNLIYTTAPKNKEIKELSERLLKSAAVIEIGKMAINEDTLDVEVLVTNKGAGHYIPTGVTEIREVWIELTAQDETGAEFFHTGMLDKSGNIEEGSIVYFTDVIDESGNSTTLFWNTVKKVSDKRLPPKATVTEKIAIPLNDAKGTVQVNATLNYRSVSPKGLAEAGVLPETVKVPIFAMASAKAILDSNNN